MRLRPILRSSIGLIPGSYFMTMDDNSWIEKNSIKGIRSLRAIKTVLDISLDYKFNAVDKEQKSIVHTRSAIKLLKLCKKNGGVYIKLGQHLSAMVHLLYSFSWLNI
jgi:predicted unusual protein kinase regulating ubiquinone biosynthesis (AarF/ABC1/UbiB family)